MRSDKVLATVAFGPDAVTLRSPLQVAKASKTLETSGLTLTMVATVSTLTIVATEAKTRVVMPMSSNWSVHDTRPARLAAVRPIRNAFPLLTDRAGMARKTVYSVALRCSRSSGIAASGPTRDTIHDEERSEMWFKRNRQAAGEDRAGTRSELSGLE